MYRPQHIWYVLSLGVRARNNQKRKGNGLHDGHFLFLRLQDPLQEHFHRQDQEGTAYRQVARGERATSRCPITKECHWKNIQNTFPSLFSGLQFVKTRSHRPLQFTSNGNVFWQIVIMPKAMGTCFGDGNVFWQIQTDENATGTHFSGL